MIAGILLLCLVISLLPTVPVVKAAEVTQRYELDTDGIDVGATYLIVNAGTAGSGNGLMFYYYSSSRRDLRNQALTIQQEDDVIFIETGFTNEADCQFQFSSSSAGSVIHGNYYLDLANSRYGSGNSGNTLTFTHVDGGQYRITYSSWFRTYYLRYSNSDWTGSTSTSSVYLFKLTEHVVGYNVTFNGNGYTSGKLPEDATMLSSGQQYTIPAPQETLRKDVGEDTWLFSCWNTAADGSGTEYLPGDVITVTEDITLYADWYQQTKHTVSMITYLDNVLTDVEKIAGYDRQFYAVLEGGDGSYIPLTRRSDGTYSAKVVDYGTYTIYAKTESGEYEPVHGHNVVIYGQDGSTECLHYSVSYDANGGTWAEGEPPAVAYYHFGEPVIVSDKVPVKEGYSFRGWKAQNGVLYTPGQRITDSASEKVTLTAVWDELITVTVNVMVNHNAKTTGQDNDQTMRDVIFTLLREENGVNLPVAEKTLTNGVTNADNITTYQVVFENMPQGIYHAASTKSNYEGNITYEGNSNENQTITIELQYTPENFDLAFDVEVKADNEAEKALMPKAVNVKVTYWGYDKNGVLGWHIITQQAGNNAPTTVTIDENGKGTGFYPVWRYWSGIQQAYEYRLEVTSYILPDGSIIPASQDLGLYQAAVAVTDGGRVPTYPSGSNTALPGAYFDGEQKGCLVATVEINTFQVIFDAGEGTVNGQKTITLDGQYRYPSLHDYVAVPNSSELQFIGWAVDGKLAENQEDQLLSGNVKYTALYSEKITISGTVSADATYQQDGQTVYINDIDRVETVWVVLQKKVGDVYNDVDSIAVSVTYKKNDAGKYTVGLGSYSFEDLPNDGTEYRIQTLVLNYTGTYNNDQNDTFSEEESFAKVDAHQAKAQVDVSLRFTPDDYQQAILVDASQISKDLRPTGVLAQILYRDLGDAHHYAVISQHTVEPYGLNIELDSLNASGVGYYNVWNWHTNGTLYEYQTQIHAVYGNDVSGAYSKEGTVYTDDSPFTIVYGAPNNYLKQNTDGGVLLEATLVPKQYAVHLDLNLGEDTSTPVWGLEDYIVDNASGDDQYMFLHTWSYKEQFTAYPYREGYVFKGWYSPNTNDVYIQDGVVHVGDTLATDITLTAQWEKMSGTDYTICYLELNTDKVLKSATMVSGTMQGANVVAADMAVAIDGYVYAGAMVDGVYMDKTSNPYMTITNDPVKNLMVIYYLPDGSDGYTEQVESNLELNKTAVLENDGTYTITLDTYTKDNPITTLIQQNTPLDIVMVLDQSASILDSGYLDELRSSADSFIKLIANHGRNNAVDHRIAMVGYAGSENSQAFSDETRYPIAGGNTSEWVNTGVFDSNGDFHPITVTGFHYTPYTEEVNRNGTYYTYSNGEYLLLTYHDTYYHLITAEEARVEDLSGVTVYGYVDGAFVKLTRNTSGLWLYGDRQLYSMDKFFTFHEEVWTHRSGTERRQIHGYTIDGVYTPADNHQGIYVREETKDANPELNVYKDALMPVSLGAGGSGGVNPNLTKAASHLGSNGQTYVQYGIEMANRIFAANPLEGADTERIRVVVMFTDGMPGDGIFREDEANAAIAQAYITKNTHNAYVYTVGLYPSNGTTAASDEAYFMNAVSSNYPDAQKLDDIRSSAVYSQAPDVANISAGGPYYVKIDNNYYELTYKSKYQNRQYWYCWGYDGESGRVEIYETTDRAQMNPPITNGMVGDYVIYKKSGGGYLETPYSGYYSTTDSETLLQQYFTDIVQDITTKITTEIILESDTILRDIMNQGLVLTDGTVITVYTQEGNYDQASKEIIWAEDAQGNPILEEKVSLALSSGNTTAQAPSPGLDENGDPKRGIEIITYNLNAANATDPTKDNYHPHTVDITGYDFYNWYISDTHTKGYKMVVTITRVEAMDDVQWGRSTATNNDQSGLWLPADKDGNRQLLLPFQQPTTIFVERAYVLDYGKEFTLSGWYFDDEDNKDAQAVHVDCNITNGMNWFDPENPNTTNVVDGAYGNTKYGNVAVKEDGTVTYTPTTMNWNGYDQFYVFGQTWRKTVLAQDANENGNLWNKVTVIPANNIYYEDSFTSGTSDGANDISGFVFTGAWSVVGTDDGNEENPEKQENTPYGGVHGWTDSLSDDSTYTDGTAHVTGLNGEMGAKAEFTFTGTGVEVYTRTNADSGLVLAMLKKVTDADDGSQNITLYKTLVMDNLAMSGDYYHIPTVTFKDLPYGTYTLQLIATAGNTNGTNRYEYYIDGVRVHNPLGNTTNYQPDIVKDAYGLENNAVYTEVRDILLDYGDFNTGLPDDTNGQMGAVFIDWIRDGQGSGSDSSGTGVPTYELGSFESYGPKNEVYLSSGQAIVLKVEENNTYYVGLKSLNGQPVTANLSGIDLDEPTQITIDHTADLYYRVTPINGYIVIQNGSTDVDVDGDGVVDPAVLSITNLRTTNLTKPAENSGVLPVVSQDALAIMTDFSGYILEKQNAEPQPEEPEAPLPSVEEQMQDNQKNAEMLFTAVKQWLATA